MYIFVDIYRKIYLFAFAKFIGAYKVDGTRVNSSLDLHSSKWCLELWSVLITTYSIMKTAFIITSQAH